jgi:hypothetical protein
MSASRAGQAFWVERFWLVGNDKFQAPQRR